MILRKKVTCKGSETYILLPVYFQDLSINYVLKTNSLYNEVFSLENDNGQRTNTIYSTI